METRELRARKGLRPVARRRSVMKGFSWMDVEAATGWLPRSHRALPMRIIIKFAARRSGHWTYKAAAYSNGVTCADQRVSTRLRFCNAVLVRLDLAFLRYLKLPSGINFCKERTSRCTA